MCRSCQEVHVLLKNRGKIDPKNAQEYADNGGFAALEKALAMTPEEILETVKAAGLRGRGGAGFPTLEKDAVYGKCGGSGPLHRL